MSKHIEYIGIDPYFRIRAKYERNGNVFRLQRIRYFLGIIPYWSNEPLDNTNYPEFKLDKDTFDIGYREEIKRDGYTTALKSVMMEKYNKEQNEINEFTFFKL